MNLEYGDISEDIPSYKRYQSIYNMISTIYPDERAGDIASSWTNDIQKSNDKFFVKLDAATDNRDEFRISELVGSVMGNYEFMLGDMIIYAGVMRLMDEGLIEVVDQWKKNPMNTLVRKI